MDKSSIDECELPACRICLSDINMQNLISPCQCTGTLKYVHQNCLQTWISSKFHPLNTSRCQICNFYFQMKYSQNYKCHCTRIFRINRCLVAPLILGLQFFIAFVMYLLIQRYQEADSNDVKVFSVVLIIACFVAGFVMIGVVGVAAVRVCMQKGVSNWEILNWDDYEVTVVTSVRSRNVMGEREAFESFN